MTRKAEIDPVIAEYEKLCAYNPEQGEGFLKGVLAVAEGRVAFDALRGRWITAYPNGKDHEGRPLFIGPDDRVLAGLGKNNGKKLDDTSRPKPSESLAWRGSSQRRNTKEDYEEREYWINEKRQSSKKELKREQKKAQKLERQSEQAAQKLQEHPLSPEQKRAEATRQRFLNTPLPDHFESSGQAVDYLNKVAPNVDATDLKYMPAQRAHDVAFAVSKLGTNFPHAFDKGFAFMLPDAEESRINAAKTKLQAEVNAGKFMAEATAEFESLATDPNFTERTISDAVHIVKGASFKTSRYQLFVRLKAVAVKFGLNPHSASVSELISSEAYAEFKKAWTETIAGARESAEREVIANKQTALDELKTSERNNVFAQYDNGKRQIWLLCCKITDPSDADADLAELDSLYNTSTQIGPRKPFHPPLQEGITSFAAITVHELMHCIDFSFKDAPISLNHQIVELFHKAREQYLDLLAEKDRARVNKAFWAYDKGVTKLKIEAPYALYSCHEFVAEQITECLTAPKPTKEAQLTFKIFKQIYDMRVDGNGG